jgi:hypothetical protein
LSCVQLPEVKAMHSIRVHSPAEHSIRVHSPAEQGSGDGWGREEGTTSTVSSTSRSATQLGAHSATLRPHPPGTRHLLCYAVDVPTTQQDLARWHLLTNKHKHGDESTLILSGEDANAEVAASTWRAA